MDSELLKKIEAVLFASGRFLDESRIAEVLEIKTADVKKALAQIREKYDSAQSALMVLEEDGAWKLHVRDEYLDIVSKIISDTEVSGPVLETLAVVSWRSPILQAEVIGIRGTNAYEHIKELVERGFVIKEPSGRSYNLRITEKFFEYFDIEGRDDIRKVFKEVEEAHRQQEMELELAQKRLEKMLEEKENEVTGDAPLDEASGLPAGKEPTGEELQPQKKVNIDDLDAVLEKSQKRREQIAAEMKEMRGISDEDADEPQGEEE